MDGKYRINVSITLTKEPQYNERFGIEEHFDFDAASVTEIFEVLAKFQRVSTEIRGQKEMEAKRDALEASIKAAREGS